MPILIFLLLLLPPKLDASAAPHPEFMAACQNPTEVQREFLQAVKNKLNTDKLRGPFSPTAEDCLILHQDMVNRKRLSLYDNLSDISLLRYYPHFTSIKLDKGNITDISVLTYLTQLTHVNLSKHPITSLAPLRTLEKLERIMITGLSITSIEPISQLLNLRSLYLISYGEVKDFHLLDN